VPTPAGPSTPTETPPPAVPTKAALKIFTFPDGHVSFSYPGNWTVKTETHPRNPIYEEENNDSYFALVSDSAGNELVSIKTGLYGIGCAAGQADRTNLDIARVPGLKQTNGGDVVLGFARQVYPFSHPDYYEMWLSRPENFPEGKGVSSGCILVNLPNGGLIASVIFNDPAFPRPGSCTSVDGDRAVLPDKSAPAQPHVLLAFHGGEGNSFAPMFLQVPLAHAWALPMASVSARFCSNAQAASSQRLSQRSANGT
jgi:hypothetical protein